MKLQIIDGLSYPELKIDGQDAVASGKIKEAVIKMVNLSLEEDLSDIFWALLDYLGDNEAVDNDLSIITLEV